MKLANKERVLIIGSNNKVLTLYYVFNVVNNFIKIIHVFGLKSIKFVKYRIGLIYKIVLLLLSFPEKI